VSALPDIPAHEHRISRIAVDGNAISFRLVSDIHPGYEADAYELQAFGVQGADQALAFLLSVKEEEDQVFTSYDGKKLTLSTESGLEYTLVADGFKGGPVEVSVEELRFALEKVYRWYVAENQSVRQVQSKLQSVRALLVDQAQRIATKSVSHAPDSAPGVLYAQHLSFVERLLRESEV
jgi:hypothetical protein